MKKVFAVIILILSVTIGTNVFAEGEQTKPGTHLNQQVEKPNSSPGTPEAELNLKPMTQEEVKQGFAKMEKDLTEKGKSASVPVAMGCLLLGIIFMFVGVIVSKKLAVAGLGLVGIAFISVLVLGDLKQSVAFLQELAVLIKSWM